VCRIGDYGVFVAQTARATCVVGLINRSVMMSMMAVSVTMTFG
jgi:hypothetical protein